MKTKLISFLMVSIMLTTAPSVHALVLIDNTNNGGNALSFGGIPLAGNNPRWKAVNFTNGSTPYILDSLKLGFASSENAPQSAGFDVGLFLADSLNNPTGTALASQHYTASINPTSEYFDFNLTQPGFALLPNTAYDLMLFNSTVSAGDFWWTSLNPDTFPIASGGLSNINLRFSLDSGSTWLSPAANSAIELNGHVAGAVPEPEEYALMLLGFGMLGWQVKRKQRKVA